MKKTQIKKVIAGIVAGCMLIISSLLITTINVQAATTTTVNGTVKSGTNSSILYLSTPQGDMSIKLDSGTDTSSCKLLTPGKSLYVDVYYGNDAYMHASKISSSSTSVSDSGSGKTWSITGTIADKPMDGNILFVNMNNDQMQLKLDSTTDYSASGVLYAGKEIAAVVYRGDDAYMHAKSISDGAGSSAGTSYSSASSGSGYSGKTTPVTGTISSESKNGLLVLNASEGTYQLKLDSNTGCSNGYMLIPGQKITANIYRGDDAYMHVAYTTRTGKLSAASSGSTTMSFSGTVDASSNDSVMQLKTSGGTMSIRLDANTTSNGPVFSGSSVSVNCINCSDEFWHAVSISVSNSTGNSTSTTTTSSTSSGSYSGTTTPVTGTVSSNSKAGLLVLNASEGTYQLKLDSNTSYSNGFLLISGQKVTANIYRGNDAYMHVASINRAGSQSNVSSGSTTMSFSGTVGSGTTEGALILVTSGGNMTIRLDSNTQYNNSVPLFVGSKVTTTCVNCSDEFWHATSLTAN